MWCLKQHANPNGLFAVISLCGTISCFYDLSQLSVWVFVVQKSPHREAELCKPGAPGSGNNDQLDPCDRCPVSPEGAPWPVTWLSILIKAPSNLNDIIVQYCDRMWCWNKPVPIGMHLSNVTGSMAVLFFLKCSKSGHAMVLSFCHNCLPQPPRPTWLLRWVFKLQVSAVIQCVTKGWWSSQVDRAAHIKRNTPALHQTHQTTMEHLQHNIAGCWGATCVQSSTVDCRCCYSQHQCSCCDLKPEV